MIGAENVAPDAVVMPKVRSAPAVSQAVSGRPSPSTSMTSVEEAPGGMPSPAAGQPVPGLAAGVVALELGSSVGDALVALPEGSDEEEELVDEELVVVGEGSSPAPEQPVSRSVVGASAARLSERVRRGDAWVLLPLV